METSRRTLLTGGAGALLTAGTSLVLADSAEAAWSAQYATYQKALTQRGKPYIWGAAGTRGYDCSGLVMWSAWNSRRIRIPHWTHDQYRFRRVHPVTGFYNVWNAPARGSNIGRDKNIRTGDLIYFFKSKGGAPDHVGFYVGKRMTGWPGNNFVVNTTIYNARTVGTRLRNDTVESFRGTYRYVRAYRIW